MAEIQNICPEEEKGEFVETIVDAMVREMTYEQMRNYVWDMFYDDLIFQEWTDLLMYAEQYAPELLEDQGG